MIWARTATSPSRTPLPQVDHYGPHTDGFLRGSDTAIEWFGRHL